MNSKDGIDFAMLFTLRERRRTSDSALSRIRSKVLRRHPRRLDSEALRRLQRWGKLLRNFKSFGVGPYYPKMWLDIMISIGYTTVIFNT